LYYGLEQAGEVRRVVTDTEIEQALITPPLSSPRATVRGLAARKFSENIEAITWSRITLRDRGGQTVVLPLTPLTNADPKELREALENTNDVASFLQTVHYFSQKYT
jgi:hypothetical protein